ncbi:acyltransferase family protein [Carboxylicivirga linearis]|uniref:Acyltransferase n=1 Tax=Carboxylicivirga linearis TaxID=1628157 RepID=A0ABS5JRV1_9BACT|nr:acyltransferase [Carboxylicivirga linearis]MBS2097623.1 acyltransferase [Carboxylicivirga linearis]
MKTTERRYDIDWLRVIAIALLLIYHSAIVFQPWGVLIGFIQSNKGLSWLWVAMSMLNVWRIPLLFFVSGMGVCFAMRKRNWKQLVWERSKRILLPFIVGMFVIVPIHVFIWQRYYSQPLSYDWGRGHLWFLGNIFSYVIILLPVFYLLKHKADVVQGYVSKVFSHPLSILIAISLFVIEVVVVKPDSFELYAMTLHGYVLGFIAFLIGFLMVYSGKAFWQRVLSMRWIYLTLAITFYLVRVIKYELIASHIFTAIESILWIYTIFSFGYRYLNHSNKALAYLSKAAYPVYILHMIFLYWGASLLIPFQMPAFITFAGVNLFSFAGSLLVYELLLKRIWWIGLGFGLNTARNIGQKHYAPKILVSNKA